MQTETWVEEFLVRRRPSWSDQPSEYHVVIGTSVTTASGRRTVSTTPPMTPAEAAAEGYDLATLIEGINAGALVECTKAVAEVAQARAERDAMMVERDSAIAARDDARAISVVPVA